MATTIAVYFGAIVLAIAIGDICDRLDKIADHLHNIDLYLAAKRHDRRADNER